MAEPTNPKPIHTPPWHILFRDIAIPLIVALVAIVTTYISGLNSTSQAEIQIRVELESKLIDQRLALIDRTAKVFGKSPGLLDYWQHYKQGLSPNNGSSKLPVDLIEKLAEAQGEFQSVLFLSNAYFGPRTHAAISELSAEDGPWWQKPKAKQDALIVAMLSETGYGLSMTPTVVKPAPLSLRYYR